MSLIQAKIMQQIQQKQNRKKSAVSGKRSLNGNFGIPQNQPFGQSFDFDQPKDPQDELHRKDS